MRRPSLKTLAATATAQAGNRNTRRADDHDHIPRATAHLLVTVSAVGPAATMRRRAGPQTLTRW